MVLCIIHSRTGEAQRTTAASNNRAGPAAPAPPPPPLRSPASRAKLSDPNPGEGVPEPEPGGPNRASDSAALGTVYVITSPHQSSETGGYFFKTDHCCDTKGTECSHMGGRSSAAVQLAVRDFFIGARYLLLSYTSSRFPFPATIAQPFC